MLGADLQFRVTAKYPKILYEITSYVQRVKVEDRKCGTTYQLLGVRVLVRVRVLYRARVRVGVSSSCKMDGSFTVDIGISKFHRLNKIACFDSLYRKE